MLRNTIVRLVSLILVFAVGSGAVGTAQAAGPNQCSAVQGQLFIDQGRYDHAIREFTCVIEAQPTEVEGYRGRAEAKLLLGHFSDALADYNLVTAVVVPVHPDAATTILASYTARLANSPENIPALTGKSFVYWWDFQYPHAIQTLNHLLDVQPDSLFGNLFRGSSRLLKGVSKPEGAADLEYAIALAPNSADVRFIVADAYTYGQPDPQRAFAEASLALQWGLDTPRIHAILASAYLAFGDQLTAATHIQTHIDLVTTELVPTSPIAAGTSLTLDLVPGRTYDIPVAATAGETISIMTSSKDFYDTILVLIAPDGSPVLGSDDYSAYFAGFEWAAEATGVYHVQVTSFEGVSIGELVVTRD